MTDFLVQNYARLPIEFVRGEGAYLWDADGHIYLDALGGIAVCVLGHANPELAHAISDQAETLLHTSNLYEVTLQRELAQKLCTISGMSRALFCNSGTEANEAAIKLARLWGHQQGMQNPGIISLSGGFHGRTMGALAATANPSLHAGFGPLPEHFYYIEYNNLSALQSALSSYEDIAAVIVEPIQGEGGVNVPDTGYLANIRNLCDQYNVLMIADEVQTGIGRTGQWFAYQHEAILPDIMTLAKALANGVPIGACLAGTKVADTFSPGQHGTTFGGNLLACRAALTTLNIIEQDNLINRAAKIGQQLLEGFNNRLAETVGVVDIRGKGCMLGIELDKPCKELVATALKHNLLINVTASNVIRLLPPFILNDDQVDIIVDTVATLVINFLQDQ